MENVKGVKKYLATVEKGIKDIDLSVQAMTNELNALKLKQGSLNRTFGFLKEILEEDFFYADRLLDGNLDSNMAREIINEEVKVILLKNGQVGSPFCDEIALNDFNIPQDAIIELSNLDDLVWNKEESSFVGTPTLAGEFKGELRYWLNEQDQMQDLPAIKRKVYFLVNPDPKSLWKNIDPPADDPYFKENSSFKIDSMGERKVLGASVRGKSHAHKGTFRDDDFAIEYWNESKWVLQVVADGAGSAELSREGSKIACKTTVNEISVFLDNKERLTNFENLLIDKFSNDNADFDEEISKQIYELTVGTAFNAHKAISKFADETENSIKTFATTLLFSLCKKFDFGTLVITFSVGDGAIGVIQADGASLLMKPDGGEYSGQTYFLTMPEIFRPLNPDDIRKRYGVKCFKEDLTSLILMTDGISDPKFETDNNLEDPKCWRLLWEELKPVVTDKNFNSDALYDWMDFEMKGEYDDRTISILF